MIKEMLLGFVVIVIVFAAVIALQPSAFRVERSATISAPAEVVFAQVNDFRKWEAWSPWAKMDPAVKNSFSGPASGVGAGFAWDGNDQVGSGNMMIVQSRPGSAIRIKLEFLKPFKATNTADFTFKPKGNQTVVTWSMSGRKNYMSKAFGLFVSMDKMVGGDFEKGLAAMKTVSEAAARKQGS